MTESEYGKYICTELKKDIKLPGFRPGEILTELPPGRRRRMNHVIWMDNEVVPGALYSECVWFFPEEMRTEQENKLNSGSGPQAHTHPFSEVITFFGTNYDDPTDLGGEVELWLEGEQHVLTRSFLCYVPKGMTHCPLKIRRIDSPMFHFTIGPGREYR